MSLVIISMMTIVALGIVFADNGGCPCNPQPPVSKIKETENTEGNVQPMNTCMRSWIEYRNCGPRRYDEHEYVCGCTCIWTNMGRYCMWNCCHNWEQQCDKYRIWYNNCTHQMMYEEYLGRVTRSGTDREHGHYGIRCICG